MFKARRRQMHRSVHASRSPAQTAIAPAVEPLESRLLLTGNVLASVASGSLRIVGDGAANDIVITQTGADEFKIASGKSATTINGGAGPVTLGGVTRDIRADLGEGDDVLTLTNVNITRDLRIDGGNGDNKITIDPSTVGRNLVIQNGQGKDTIKIDDTDIGRNVTIDNGDGGSDIDLIGGSTVGGDVSITNGAGYDDLYLEGPGAVVTGKLTVKNDKGGSKQELKAGVTIGRDVLIINGNGDKDDFKTDGDKGLVMLGGKLTILDRSLDAGVELKKNTTVTGNVFVRNQGGALSKFKTDGDKGKPITFGGHVTLQNDNGGSEVEIKNNTTIAGNLTVTNKAGGQDNFKLDGSADKPVMIAGNVKLLNSDGDTKTEIKSASTIGGSLSIVNKRGDDTFTMEKTGNVVGNVTIDNGTGDATVTINDKPAATDTVGGDLTIKNSAGETTFNTKAATFAGKVTVETHSVATAKIDGAMIGGNLTLTSGDGWDTIQILNSAVTGKTTIKTGDGNDVVNIERSASAAPPSTFTGFAYINTGDGDDKVNVGTGVGNGAANFNGGLTIDGGPGLDTLLVVLPGSTTDGGATFAPKLISIA